MSLAVFAADNVTNGSPPPGWADPPTKNRPETRAWLAARRKAADVPLDEEP